MQRLWRPWRMAYIKGPGRRERCFLCEARDAPPSEDEDKLVLVRGRTCLAILNIFPYNTGHLMVAPYRHAGELDDLTHEESDELLALTRRAVAVHRATTHPQGFNIGINLGEAAGAGVPGHLHAHVVPRWGGDVNFMPVTADTKVLPEMLTDTYRTLRPAFDEAHGG